MPQMLELSDKSLKQVYKNDPGTKSKNSWNKWKIRKSQQDTEDRKKIQMEVLELKNKIIRITHGQADSRMEVTGSIRMKGW